MTDDQLRHIDVLLGAVDKAGAMHKSYEYADVLQQARDAYAAYGNRERAAQLQWELEAWRLRSAHAWEASDQRQPFMPMLVNEDGSVWPDLAGFPREQLDYLAARAEATANQAVRAHYLDIVWTRRRNHVDGRGAVDAYIQLLQSAGSLASEPAGLVLLLQHAATRSLALALELNDPELVQWTRGTINDRLDQLVSCGEFRWTIELAKAFLLRANRVERSDLEHAANCVELAAEHFAQQENGLLELSTLELAVKLRTKLGADQQAITVLRERWAQSHVREGERREADSPMAASHAYMTALVAYRNLGVGKFATQIADLEHRIKTHHERGRVEAAHFETPIRIDFTGTDQLVAALLAAPGDSDLHAIAHLDAFIPSLAEIRRATEDQRSETPLLYLFPRATMRDDNVVQRAQTEAEIFDDLVAESYGHHLQVNLVLLARLVDRLATVRRWQRGRLMRHIRRAAFFAGRDLRLLDHALRRYFARDYVSAVQLLALQVEPALRAILPLLGLATTITDPRQGVTREKNLDELLVTDELAELLGEEYVYFVRFVLTDQRGPLLRHGTAHGLITVDICHIAMAHLLVYMLLWLTRFVSSHAAKEQSIGNDTP